MDKILLAAIGIILIELCLRPRFDRTTSGKIVLWYGGENRKYIIFF